MSRLRTSICRTKEKHKAMLLNNRIFFFLVDTKINIVKISPGVRRATVHFARTLFNVVRGHTSLEVEILYRKKQQRQDARMLTIAEIHRDRFTVNCKQKNIIHAAPLLSIALLMSQPAAQNCAHVTTACMSS